MKTIGFDKPLYILPFDHRASFQKGLFGWKGTLSPDVWKIEGLDRREDCEKIVSVARRNDREKVGCIILGRGEDDAKACEWLRTAASVPGFIGFAVGRTTLWNALVKWRDNQVSTEGAVSEIAGLFRGWVDVFESARAVCT